MTTSVHRPGDPFTGYADTPLARDRSRWSCRVRPPRGNHGSSYRRCSGDVTTSSGLSFRMRESIRRHRVAEPTANATPELNTHSSLTGTWRNTITGRLSRDSDTLNAVDRLSLKRSESFTTETAFRPPACSNHNQRRQQTTDAMRSDVNNYRRIEEWVENSLNHTQSNIHPHADRRADVVQSGYALHNHSDDTRLERGQNERRQLPPLTNEKAAPPPERYHEYSSLIMPSPAAHSSGWTEPTNYSSDSWSSESLDIPSEGGSDSTDFTPGEFVDYPRLTLPTSSSRPTSESSGTLYGGGGGLYVARITITNPTTHNGTATASDCEQTNRQRSDRTSPLQIREHDVQFQPSNSCDVSYQYSNTMTNERSPILSVDDCKISNMAANSLQSHDAFIHRNDDCKIPSKQHKTRQKERSSASPIKNRITNDGTSVNLERQLLPEGDNSMKTNKSESPLKHPSKYISRTNSNCSFGGPLSDSAHRHKIQRQAIEGGDLASLQINNGEAHFKHRRTSNDDGYVSVSIKDRCQTISSTTSTATELEDHARRENKRIKHPTSELDRRSPTSSDDGTRTNSRSTIVGDEPVQREQNQNNDEPEHHRNRKLSGKRRDVTTERRASAGENAIIKDAAFYRCCGPDATNISADVLLCSPAAENSEVPSQIFHPPEDRNTPTNMHATRSISERSPEHAKLDQMKRYCLKQLALPSKSIPEVAKRRRGNQQRILAAEIPPSPLNVLTSKFGGDHSISASAAAHEYALLNHCADEHSLASALEDIYYNDRVSNTSRATSVSHEYLTPREYASRHKYSTITRGGVPRPISTNDDSVTSSTKTNRRQHSFSDAHGSKYESQTLDRRRGRESSDNSDRKRKVLDWPSSDADTARIDCSSSVSSRTNTLSRGGRLSVTITDNEPEPEIQRMVGVGQTTVPSTELEDLRNSVRACSNQFYAILATGNDDVTDQKLILGPETLPSGDSDDEDKKSSSSEATVYGVCKDDSDETTGGRNEYFRLPTKRISTPGSSKQRCVDAAVQVVVEELELKRRNLSSCPPTSERDSATKVDRVQTLLADLDWTDDTAGNSPETESSSSREYFRRSGKDAWRASLAVHGPRRKIAVDNQSETTRSSRERLTPTAFSRRKHRHSVALVDSAHSKHLDSNRLSHNRHERTAAVPAEASFQTSKSSNRQNEVAKRNVEERYETAMSKDKGQQEVLPYCRSSDLVAAQERPRHLKVQPSAAQKRTSLGLVDSPSIDAAVQDMFNSKETDVLVNRNTSLQVENKSEKKGEHELPAACRSREIRPDEVRLRETSTMSRSGRNEPTEPCGRVSELTDNNCDLWKNSDAVRSAVSHHSVSTDLDASLEVW